MRTFFLGFLIFFSNVVYSAPLDFEKLNDSVLVVNVINFAITNIGPVPRVGNGTAFYVTDDIIVTASHVIESSDYFEMRSENSDVKIKGKIIARDKKADLLFLKVNVKGKPFPLNTKKLIVGEDVYAIGHPLGIQFTLTKGIISSTWHLDRSLPTVKIVQTDTPINPGNSGGPIFNANGEVLGMASFIYSPSRGNIGINFAVSSVHIKRMLDSILRHGSAKRLELGVAYGERSDGVYFVKIHNDKMNKYFIEGDKIVAINGVNISSLLDLVDELFLKDPRSNPIITVERNNEILDITVLNKDLV